MNKHWPIAILTGIAAVSILLISGCHGQPADEGNSEELFFQKKEVSQTLTLTDEAIVNPLMGYAPEATSTVVADRCSLVYVDVTFRELQPQSENAFDFAAIEKENNLELWRSQGKHVVFRFVCDKPTREPHRDIPDWLYEKIGGDGTNYDISYGKGFAPDYTNEVFIAYHAKAIKALGEHFGGDTFFSYIELGSLGHWGEWHVNYEAGIQRIPKADVRDRYIQPYVEAFPHAKILMRRPFEAAETYGFGVFNDMAGEPASTEEWLDWIENGGDYSQAEETDALAPMPNAWKTAPIGGEFNSDFTMDYMLKTNLTQTVDLIARSHTTFLGPKCPVSTDDSFNYDTQYVKGMDQVLKSMGYRIGITKMEISRINSKGVVRLDLAWSNAGVSPFYFDWPVYVYVLDASDNIQTRQPVNLSLSKLLPGKSLKTSTDVTIGQTKAGQKVCIGIEDPMTNAPAVMLMNDFERTVYNLTPIYQYAFY